MKHAFLIIAHNELEVLKALISLLDNRNNDLYIHMDKKFKTWNENELKKCAKRSKIKVLSEISVNWGDASQVECQYLLLRSAFAGEYDYYHFLSGADLPLKSNLDIHTFFRKHAGKQFIHFDSPVAGKEALNRVMYRHPFGKYLKCTRYKTVTKVLFLTDDFLVKIQTVLGLKRKLYYETIQKGCNWCSITKEFADYVLREEKKVMVMLKKSLCGDEIFIQTLCVNSPFIHQLYDKVFSNNYNACKRLIIWNEENRKSPKVLREEDWGRLLNTSSLFGRKFSMDKQKDFTQRWISHIRTENRRSIVR
ncbi:glycosyl transferase [Anaerocolumna cellulosilytica]|uniref:Peptide O-xylosyltransferase n=1 Tax=Anaerocolumna cellulosilytica TaxID=433286 RepID=A0A6S6R1F9_9FIRM|nr:beta-1,6-N-acetylglucosaminyltransferase [Anaerocolumna cellulosilytica]MBB5195261.1 hypothetical protein [Anaerocolumna cellulosilytica]BCJ96734.1 glycosyl transferase [Anaerocolumna cellulosilytica]